jgi:hypothetical protein
LAEAGERILKHQALAPEVEGMVWEDVGGGQEEDEFLANWKEKVLDARRQQSAALALPLNLLLT